MLGKGSDFSEESIEKSWGKNWLMKAVQSSSHISFNSSIELVSFYKSQVVTFNGKLVCDFRNGYCGTGSQSDNMVGSPHGFVIHGIEVLKGNEKVTEVIDVEN
ncbi:hypothetical protein Tco_0979563 [Tanacetum coccineum]